MPWGRHISKYNVLCLFLALGLAGIHLYSQALSLQNKVAESKAPIGNFI